MAIKQCVKNVTLLKKELDDITVRVVKNAFPIGDSRYKISLKRVYSTPKHFTTKDMKDAVVKRKSLYYPVKVDLELTDNKQGRVVDSIENYTFMNNLALTPDSTIIMDGNEYTSGMLMRLKPGVYTKRGNDGIVQSDFRVRGKSLRLSMHPETGIFTIKIQSVNIKLYPILHKLGVSDDTIRKVWGSKLLDVNRITNENKINLEFEHFYKALVPDQKEGEDKVERIKERLKNTALDPKTTEITLGQSFSHIEPKSMLLSSRKILDVHNGKTEEDEPDSLEFQTVDTVIDRLKNYLEKDLINIKRKMNLKMRFLTDNEKKARLEKGRGALIKFIMGSSSPMSKSVKEFYNSDQLTSTGDFINPLEKADSIYKVSKVGEGGIQSEYAITENIRQIHPSSFGLIDPIRTPLSGKVGVDQKFTEAAYKDEKGNLYLRVLDIHNFKVEKIPIYDVFKKNLILPTELKKIANILPKLRGKKTATKKELNTKVKVYKGKNKFDVVPLKDCDYIIEHTSSMFSPTTNLIPFLNSTEGVRGIMGANQLTQALPLKDPEAPLVQTVNNSRHLAHKFTNVPKRDMLSEEERLSKKLNLNVSAPTSGTVKKIDRENYIIEYLGDNGKLYKLEYHQYYPTRKTMQHHEVVCTEGEKCKKGQLLAKSLYADNKGAIALGKNLQVAYMAYKGLNHEDAIIVSESGSKKLSSVHLKPLKFEVSKDTILSKTKFSTMYPTKYNNKQLSKLDSEGVIKKGSILNNGDPIIIALEKVPLNVQVQQLMKIHKSFSNQVKTRVEEWKYEFEGKVIDVFKGRSNITVTIEYSAPAVIGDKLSGRFGNKGVIVDVIPDDKMPRAEDSKTPLDVMLTPAGVVGRINPSQLMEVSLGEVGKKQNKPIKVESFAGKDNLQYVKNVLKKNKVNPYKKIFDPTNNKTTLTPVQTGYHYIMKLSKTTEGNYNARSTGSYDMDEQPLKVSGTNKKFGNPLNVGLMEINGFVGHNAREMLKDIGLKGQKNTDYWNAIKFNKFLPQPKDNFAFKHKFKGLLNAAALDIKKDNDNWKLIPMTSKHIKEVSSGKIQNYKQVSVKNFEPEKGGLFDKKLTGGLNGDKYSHIELDEPVIHPMFIDPIRLMLGMKKREIERLFEDMGGKHIQNLLRQVDLDKLEKKTYDIATTAKGQKLSDAVKLIKYVRTLKANKLRPEDVFLLDAVSVIPPKLRPLMVVQNRIEQSSLNLLYRDIMMNDETLKEMKQVGLPDEIKNQRSSLQKSVAALIGLGKSPNIALRSNKGVKGAIEVIKGDIPKSGFFHKKLIKKRQDFSGRATIAPDVNLNIDEIGIPEDMAWETYGIFAGQKLSRMGYNPMQVEDLLKNRTKVAKEALISAMKDRPVYVNRPPTLWKHSIFAAYPKLTSGKTLKVSPFIEAGCNADYDGDALIVQVPMSEKAKEEAKKKTLTYQLFSDKSKDDLLIKPSHEPILGMFKSTKDVSKNTKTFNNFLDMEKALNEGKIHYNQKIKFNSKNPFGK